MMSQPFSDLCKECHCPVRGITAVGPSHLRKVFSSRGTMKLVGIRLKDGSGCICVACFKDRFRTRQCVKARS
ncbi:hypothetical protein LCGC14_1550580 [marine sediment metagenome]|uniref:Uncharacterized protein n=1 Tax=marine sediment metagenome TaxID=412755 RepID=A0A0F9LR76_9ZZZZ